MFANTSDRTFSAAALSRFLFTAMVSLAPLLAQAGPKIEQWTLDNGTRVYFVPARELPMVQLRAVFDAASARDPQDKSGLAQLANSMLREGAAGLTADEIARRFESLGAEFGTGAGRDMATVDLRSLTERALLEPALELFGTILAAPTYPAESFERERQRALVGLAREAQSPGEMAQNAFMRALYGSHPYALPPSGDERSLKNLERGDLVAHHTRYYVGRNLKLVIVGDLSSRAARRVARTVAGALPAGEPAPPLPQVTPLAAARIERFDFPASQSHLLIGQPALARGEEDHFALQVGNYILGGGGLVSRLSSEVREKRGLSYSVYSGFSPMRVAGPFQIGLQTQNATLEQARALVIEVLREFLASGPTPEELDAAKKNITGGFALQLDSNRKIADQLSNIAYYDLPLDYLDQFQARILAVTIEQVRDAFARRVQPDRMVTVILGGKS